MNTESPTWKYLARKPKSHYRQLFVKDRWVAARTLYGQSVGEDARTPEQLAHDFDLPLEAIAYCKSNPPGDSPGLGEGGSPGPGVGNG